MFSPPSCSFVPPARSLLRRADDPPAAPLSLALVTPRLPTVRTDGARGVRCLARWPVAKTNPPSSLLFSRYAASRCRRCRPHPASRVVRAPLARGRMGCNGASPPPVLGSLCPGQPRATTVRWLSPFPALPGHARRPRDVTRCCPCPSHRDHRAILVRGVIGGGRTTSTVHRLTPARPFCLFACCLRRAPFLRRRFAVDRWPCTGWTARRCV